MATATALERIFGGIAKSNPAATPSIGLTMAIHQPRFRIDLGGDRVLPEDRLDEGLRIRATTGTRPRGRHLLASIYPKQDVSVYADPHHPGNVGETIRRCIALLVEKSLLRLTGIDERRALSREDFMSDHEGVHRRDVLKGIGMTGAAVGMATTTAPPALAEAQAQATHGHPHPPERNGESADIFRYFTPPEAAVIVALVDTLIPKDDVGPGGVEVGVPIFIDRELAGAYGRGARMFLNGPFSEGTPQQGYQLPLPPADLYRVGIADLNAWCAKTRDGRTFDRLSTADRTTALKALEAGQAEFTQIPSRAFFSILLQNTMEGYFADPMYGGNRNNAVWTTIGFPGAVGMYSDLIEQYRNKQYVVAPKSIQDLS